MMRMAWGMVIATSLLHLAWAVLLLKSPDVINTTPLYGIASGARDLAGAADWADGLVIGVLISSALAAIIGGRIRGLIGLGLMLPQQYVLLLSASTAIFSAYSGSYPDGTVRSWSFILADQMLTILAAPLYTMAVLSHLPDRATAPEQDVGGS